MAIEVKHYKVKQLPSSPTPNSIYWVKASTDSEVSGYITDLQGVPYPLKDISGSAGIQSIVNSDGNITIVGTDNLVINISPALLSVINSALQSGDNISELINDAGYLTTFVETDPVFQASEASLFVAGDKVNLDNQSGINSGDETTLSIQTKRPLKTINNESLEGSGNVQIDYNDYFTLGSPVITVADIANFTRLNNFASNVAFSQDTGISDHSLLSTKFIPHNIFGRVPYDCVLESLTINNQFIVSSGIEISIWVADAVTQANKVEVAHISYVPSDSNDLFTIPASIVIPKGSEIQVFIKRPLGGGVVFNRGFWLFFKKV